jgi:hypothetical protein
VLEQDAARADATGPRGGDEVALQVAIMSARSNRMYPA